MRGALAVSHSPIMHSREFPACGTVTHSATSMHSHNKDPDVYFTSQPLLHHTMHGILRTRGKFTNI